MDAIQDPRRVIALQQQDRPLDDVVLLVLADDAVALQVGELELAEVAQQDRRAVALRDHDGAEIVERLHEADAADDVAEVAARSRRCRRRWRCWR